MNLSNESNQIKKQIEYFEPAINVGHRSIKLKNPFDNEPDEVAIKASHLLQQKLELQLPLIHPFFNEHEGKMFGVLVVANEQGQIGYLSAFSGMLNNQWLHNGFVPPVFDVKAMASLLEQGEMKLKHVAHMLFKLENNEMYQYLQAELIDSKQNVINALVTLKKCHKQRKKQRNIQRKGLALKAGVEIELASLSQQSQDDKREYKTLKKNTDAELLSLKKHLNDRFEGEINQLKNQRKRLSQNLHTQVFDQYQLKNIKGVIQPIKALFEHKLPPGGAGDCAAPKLLHFALKHKLKVLALAEFWWGAAPKKEIRHHRFFYAPCRSKCHHILPFMLNGINVVNAVKKAHKQLQPFIIYEDDSLVVLNKPEGMLSIPGIEEKHSVLTWLQQHYPNAEGALLLHRLDQATSGILLAAKTSDVYKAIQKQFIDRSIKKRYVALLSKKINKVNFQIELPLRGDFNDRPRQLVCFKQGKHAQTTVEKIQDEGEYSRVYFYPKTGRTHQLRVHAAHELGLANPIVGDALYGKKDKRLMLHAEKIEFYHPVKLKTMMFKIDVPF